MLRDRIENLFIDQDYNCAESMLHAANDEYGLGIDKDAFKLVGGYGGGSTAKRPAARSWEASLQSAAS